RASRLAVKRKVAFRLQVSIISEVLKRELASCRFQAHIRGRETPIRARDDAITPRPGTPSMVPGHSIHGGRMPRESINRRLSRWVAGLSFSDIPPEALDRARGVTLQGLSSCLLGHEFPETKQAIRLVEEEEQGVAGTTTALVDGRCF